MTNKQEELERMLKTAPRKIAIDIQTNQDSRYETGKYCQFRYDPKTKEIRMSFQASERWYRYFSATSTTPYSKYMKMFSYGPYRYSLTQLGTALSTARKRGIRARRLYLAVKKVVQGRIIK